MGQELDRRVLLHELQGERQVAGHLAQHPQLFFTDGTGLVRGEHECAHRGVVNDQRQSHQRVQPRLAYHLSGWHRGIERGGIVADVGGGAADDPADDGGPALPILGHHLAERTRDLLIHAAPGNRLHLGHSRGFRAHDGGGVTAHSNGEATGLLQQLLAVTDTHDQSIDSTQHAQNAIQSRELGLLPLPFLARLSVRKRAAHGGRQAREVAFQHVVRGAAQQRIDRPLFADRPGHIDERDLGGELGGDAQRRHAVELRQAEIRQDQGGGEVLERLPQTGFGLDAHRGALDARASQLRECELGLVVEVLDEQDADRSGSLFRWHDLSLSYKTK